MGMPRPHFHKHSVQKYNSHRRGAVFLYLFQVTCRRNWLAAMIYERFQYEHALQITFFFARHIDRLPTSPWKAFVQVWCKLSNSTAPFSSYKRVIYFWPYISFPVCGTCLPHITMRFIHFPVAIAQYYWDSDFWGACLVKHMLKAYYIYMSVQLLLLLLLPCWIGHFLLNHASSFAYAPSVLVLFLFSRWIYFHQT